MTILIADTMHPSLMPMLEQRGLQADYFPDIQRSEILNIIEKYKGIIIRSKTAIDKAFLAKATDLQFIARAGAGLDQIDVEAVAQRRIQVFNAPEGNRDAVAEHAMAMLLCLFNKIHLGDQQVRREVWNREGNRGIELGGKTVGIIGYGNTGKAFARRVKAFGCQILAYDKYLSGFSDEFVREASMQEIVEQCEVLSLHIPLTSETNNLVTTSFLSKFKKDIFIINTARGEIIPLTELLAGLQSGKLRGACLDVLENEKLQTLSLTQRAAFDVLVTLPNVLFTPHVAGWTHESYIRINKVLVEKIATWIGKAASM